MYVLLGGGGGVGGGGEGVGGGGERGEGEGQGSCNSLFFKLGCSRNAYLFEVGSRGPPSEFFEYLECRKSHLTQLYTLSKHLKLVSFCFDPKKKVINFVHLNMDLGCAVRLETRRSRVQPPPRSATFFRGD